MNLPRFIPRMKADLCQYMPQFAKITVKSELGKEYRKCLEPLKILDFLERKQHDKNIIHLPRQNSDGYLKKSVKSRVFGLGNVSVTPFSPHISEEISEICASGGLQRRAEEVIVLYTMTPRSKNADGILERNVKISAMTMKIKDVRK